jgi:hypothetical protein
VTYAELYGSFIQHPLLLWAAAILGLAAALSRTGLSSTVRGYCVVLTTMSLLDAWLTGNQVLGIGSLTGAAASFVPLTFVLLGDFRYFLFVEIAKPDGALSASAGAFIRACAWTLLVPLLSQLVLVGLGSSDSRILFIVYELLFVLLAIGINRLYLPRRSHALLWTRRVTNFVIVYYALWATADALILVTGLDAGYLLRMLPNVFYYGGLVPMIAWAWPKP